MKILGLATIMLFMASAYLVAAADKAPTVEASVAPAALTPNEVAPAAPAAKAPSEEVPAAAAKGGEEAPASFIVESIVLRSMFGK